MPNQLSRIEHIVVLMLENRSFDHMLGQVPGVNGVTGAEENFWTPDVPASGGVRVTFDAKPRKQLRTDPGHDLDHVRVQLYGSAGDTFPVPSSSSGFLAQYLERIGGDPTDPKRRSRAEEIMKCFSLNGLPVLTGLARAFAVCDAWYSSVPGPTWPNRFFLHAATSDGMTGNSFGQAGLRTIYHNLSDAGVSWGIYFHDFPQALGLKSLWDQRFRSHFHRIGHFWKLAGAGELPAFSFVEPRYFTFLWKDANDQHPPHDVDRGENLVAAVYQVLRQSPAWERTLLLITHDEHGGIYDHASVVSLPAPAPAPPGARFDFATSGVRVPAVVASPWIAAGTVDHRPYDHSSIPATLKERFGLPNFLTARDAQATTLGDLLSLAEPRQDAPVTIEERVLPSAEAMVAADTAVPSPAFVRRAVEDREISTEPLTEFQESLVDLARELDVAGEGPWLKSLVQARAVRTEHDGAEFVQERAQRFLGLPEDE
jgi:phospholipase C